MRGFFFNINFIIKYLFITINSPAKVLRKYIFEVKGSIHSLFPKICDVDAVGMGATNNELRTPRIITF